MVDFILAHSFFHRPPPRSTGREDFGGGFVAALLVQFARHRHWGNLRRIVLQLPLHYALWLRDVARGDRRDEGRLWWAAASGAVAGVGFYLRHRHAPPVA